MRRPLTLMIFAVGLAIVASGCIAFDVTKETTGDNPPSGDFVVQIVCENDDPPETDELTFPGDEEFPQTLESAEFDFFLGAGICHISETESANAISTTIQCVDPPDNVTCTEQEDGSLDVEADFEIPTFTLVDILVTNDLGTSTTTTTLAPDPSPVAIVAEPLFTG